jgi:aryl-alcohol dehydrogenase-like predicted oxidoreductase
MEMREFGSAGIRAPDVGLGCNNFGLYQNAAQAVAVVRKALDVGINFFDMAGEHGGGLEESLVAEALGSPIPKRRAKKPCVRSMIWSARARCARSTRQRPSPPQMT